MPIKQSLKSVRQKRGNTRIHTQVMSQVVAPLHYQCFRSKLDCNATERNLSCPSPPRFSAPPHATKCILGPTDIPSANRHCYYADGSPREPVVRFRDPQRIYRLSAVRVFLRIPYANDMATGYSVPASEIDISSADASVSSGPVSVVEGPTKKVKPTPADWAGDGGSCTLPRERYNFPALAATTSSAAAVNIHGQTQSSSESSISGTTSSSLRQRRAKLATAKIAAARVVLAEARLAEIQAEADIGDEASSDSIGRRNADVLSDLDNDEPYLQVQVENANGQQVSPLKQAKGQDPHLRRTYPSTTFFVKAQGTPRKMTCSPSTLLFPVCLPNGVPPRRKLGVLPRPSTTYYYYRGRQQLKLGRSHLHNMSMLIHQRTEYGQEGRLGLKPRRLSPPTS